jgi:arginase family enzyme
VDEALADVDAAVVNLPLGSGVKGRPGGEEAVLYVRRKSKDVLIYTCNSDLRAGVVMGANGHVQDVPDREHAAYKTLGGLIKNEPRRVVDSPADADVL